MVPREAQLACDVLAQCRGGVVGMVGDGLHVGQPHIEHAMQHPAVQAFLAAEVIQQILLGGADFAGDMVQRHTAETAHRKQALGRVQDFLFQPFPVVAAALPARRILGTLGHKPAC